MHLPKLSIKKHIPILEWLPNYNLQLAVPDLISGITVGLTLIPQSLAYSTLAGLTPVYGLYSSLVGGFIYTILGTVPEFTIAPTSIMCLLAYPYISTASYGRVPASILLCFLSGIIELIFGLLQLGVLVNFVSTPVMTGFASAGAIIIASSQIRDLIGLKNSAESFLSVWEDIFENLDQARYQDTILGVVCCIVLLTLRYVRVYGVAPNSEEETRPASKWRILIWLLSISRNAIVVIVTTIIAYNLHDENNDNPFTLTTDVPAGLPTFQPPQFYVDNGNQTWNFHQMVAEVAPGLVILPGFAILANVATAKPFANGKTIEVTQEIITVGVCNIIGSFFGSMPVHAAFSRAAISNSSGSKTPFTGLYSGILVILALTFMTPYFHYIPRATLAAVVICAIIFIVDFSVLKPIWRINKIDFIPLFTTFFVSFFIGVEYGIVIGIVVHLLILLYYNARPSVKVETITNYDVEYVKVTPNSALFFPSAEYIRTTIMQLNTTRTPIIVLNCIRINRSDFTTFKCIGMLITDLNKLGKKLILLNVHKGLILSDIDERDCPIVEREEHLRDVIHNLNKLEIMSK